MPKRVISQPDPEEIRVRAYEISTGPESGTPIENWLRAEAELRGGMLRRAGIPDRARGAEVTAKGVAA